MKVTRSHVAVAVVAVITTVVAMQMGTALYKTWRSLTGERTTVVQRAHRDGEGPSKAKVKAKTPAARPAGQAAVRPAQTPEELAKARKDWWDGLTPEQRAERMKQRRAERTGIPPEEREARRAARIADRRAREAAGEVLAPLPEDSDVIDTDV